MQNQLVMYVTSELPRETPVGESRTPLARGRRPRPQRGPVATPPRRVLALVFIAPRTRASQGAHAPVAVPLRGLRPRCRELVPELLGALAFPYLCTHFTRPPRTGAVYAPCPGVQVFTPRDTESLER